MNASPHQESLLGDDVGRKKYRRSEVFVAGGQPTVTYNPRPGQGFDQRVRDYLDEKHRILCITGPTKSGKTVLIREVVPNAIRLSGGDMRTIDDFWPTSSMLWAGSPMRARSGRWRTTARPNCRRMEQGLDQGCRGR